MSQFIDILKKYTRPYYKIIIAIIVLIVFFLAAYHVLKRFNYFESFDVANDSEREGSSCIIYFFHADWCPHCKAIYSYDGSENLLWNKLEKELNNNPINGKEVKCYAVNCADDNNKSLCKNENIEGYPTIKFNGKVYKEKRDYDTIIGYLNSVVS